jgi:hypothetical protein
VSFVVTKSQPKQIHSWNWNPFEPASRWRVAPLVRASPAEIGTRMRGGVVLKPRIAGKITKRPKNGPTKPRKRQKTPTSFSITVF